MCFLHRLAGAALASGASPFCPVTLLHPCYEPSRACERCKRARRGGSGKPSFALWRRVLRDDAQPERRAEAASKQPAVHAIEARQPQHRDAAAMDKSYGSGGAYTLLDDQDALTQQQKPQTLWQSLRAFFLKGSHKYEHRLLCGAPLVLACTPRIISARYVVDRAGNELHVRYFCHYGWIRVTD